MREAYVRALAEEGRNNPRIFGLVGDIGTFTYDEFKAACPDRFVNVGIAECNMVGMAAGLALEGQIPFVYSITPFTTARALEPIRVDVCYQNLNVKIVGCGSGFSYSTLGCTHHATDDIGLMRALPNMVVISPADPPEAMRVVRAAVQHVGPVYIRIGRSKEPIITSEEQGFEIGKATQLREGRDLTIIGTGSILFNALQAAERLHREEETDIEVINMATIKPIDREAIVRSAQKTGKILTLEEHSTLGGLGSAVAEVLAEEGIAIPFKRMGLDDKFCYEYGQHV
ncbi:MAG: transketolase, partial [Nanoarchaeota archaeon]|nr:transketolase [Nanoarchaeota archaeon]